MEQPVIGPIDGAAGDRADRWSSRRQTGRRRSSLSLSLMGRALEVTVGG
jgi:hypothetical protein